MNKAKKVNFVRGIVCRTVLVIFLAFTLLPAWVMIVNSFKTPNQLLDGVLWFAFPLNFGNYAEAFNKIAPYIWNSVSISVVSTVGITLIAALTGYAFGHFEFKGKNILFAFIIVNMMIPSVLTLVPSYLVVVTLGLYDTQFAVLLPYLGGGAVMGIYLVRGFVEQLPKAVFEAAKIDGANEYTILFKLVMPLALPGLATIALFFTLKFWNDWYNALMFITDERLRNLQFLLQSMLSKIQLLAESDGNSYMTETITEIPSDSVRMALCMIAAGPILIVYPFFQRYFIQGLTVGAVKG